MTVSVAIWEADFRSAEVADACFVQESFGISGILWEISFLKRFAVDCVTSVMILSCVRPSSGRYVWQIFSCSPLSGPWNDVPPMHIVPLFV